jgi:hypothetical protein
MTTPANLTYTAIETRVMNALRLPTSNTTEQAKVQNLINMVYRDIYMKRDWTFAIKRAVINTSAKLVAGETNVLGVTAPTSVSLTINSTTATFSGVITQDIKGFVMVIPGQPNDPDAVYRIAVHGGASASATLDAAYTDATNTAASYRLYQDAYSLPADPLKVLNVKRFGEFQPIRRMGIEELSQIKLTDQTENRPEGYSVFDYTTTGDPTTQKILQIVPYPDKLYRLEIFYKQSLNTELTSSTRPFIPDDFSEVLVYGALSRGYPQFLNDKDRGDYYLKLFNDTLALMAAQEPDYAKDNPGISPMSYRRRRRLRQGGVTLGRDFDILPSEP